MTAAYYSSPTDPLLLFQFGATLFLDPFWNIDTLVEQRSRPFYSVLLTLVHQIPRSPDDVGNLSRAETVRPRHHAGLRVLSALLKHLAGTDVRNHVVAFIQRHPPAFSSN